MPTPSFIPTSFPAPRGGVFPTSFPAPRCWVFPTSFPAPRGGVFPTCACVRACVRACVIYLTSPNMSDIRPTKKKIKEEIN